MYASGCTQMRMATGSHLRCLSSVATHLVCLFQTGHLTGLELTKLPKEPQDLPTSTSLALGL